MKIWQVVVALWPCLLFPANAETSPPNSAEFHHPMLRDLNAENFHSTLGTGEPDRWIVEFYSPYCHHCKRLQPVLTATIDKFKSSGLKFAHIDCFKERTLCDKEKVDGYPTVRFYQAGQQKEELFGRSEEALSADFERILKQIPAKPADAPSKDPDDYQSRGDDLDAPVELSQYTFHGMLKADGLWLVEFFSPKCMHCIQFKPKYKNVAQKWNYIGSKLKLANVDCVANADLCGKNNVNAYPTMKLFNAGVFVEDYSGPHEEEPLLKFIEASIKKYAEASKPGANKPTTLPYKTVDITPGKHQHNTEGVNQELTNENFDKKIMKGPWIVDFFAPWCGHCQHLAPTWKKLATELKNQINVASVDCQAEPAMQSKQDIRGFPVIKFFMDGELIQEFRGPRTLENLKEFALRLSRPPVSVVDRSAFERSIGNGDQAAFLFLAKTVASNVIPESIEVAAKKNLLLAQFYASADPLLFEKFKLSPATTHFLVVKDGSYKVYPIDDYATNERVSRWVEDNRYPLIIKLDSQNSPSIFAQGKYVALLFLDPNRAETNSIMDNLRKVITVQKERSDVLFGWIDIVEWSDYAANVFGIKMGQVPTSVIVHPDGDEFYPTLSDGASIGADPSRIIVALQEAKAEKIPRYHIRGSIGGFFKSITGFVTTHPFITVIIVLFAFVVLVLGCGIWAKGEHGHYDQLGKYD